MKNLIIVGARGFGREVYELALNSKGYGKDWIVKGFLDDKKDALSGFNRYPPIISSVESYQIQKDDLFVTALGHTGYKKYYTEHLLERKAEFVNLVHKGADVQSSLIGSKGILVFNYVTISVDVTVGDFVVFQQYTAVGHDVSIGSWAHISAFSFLGGYSVIGEGVLINPGAKIVPHKKIGNWATVGAGSLVLRNVKPNTTVFGEPAKEI